MKRIVLLAMVAAVALLSLSGCKSMLGDTQVRFQNNSSSKTVEAIWDGSNEGALGPGQTSAWETVNPGTHTIQWLDAKTGKALTTIAWPNLVQGETYTFPYTD